MINKAVIAGLLIVTPLLASAQSLAPLGNLIGAIARIVGALVPILITLALVVFFWGLVRYLYDRNHDEGKQLMIWGLITLFVMVSVWGIVRLAQNALDINPNTGATSPQVLYPSSNSGTDPSFQGVGSSPY